MNWNRWLNAWRRALGSLQAKLGAGSGTRPNGRRSLDLGAPRSPLVPAPAYAPIPKR